MNLYFHEIADIFPLMTDADLTALTADIATYGQREPIWLHPDGRILDGRNRYIACTRLDLPPITRTWDGDGDLVAFVVSLNLHRRQLTLAQKALVGARIANLSAGRPIILPAGGIIASQRNAAKLLGISEHAVARGAKIIKSGVPALVAKVEHADVSLGAGAEVAGLPPGEQFAVVRQGNAAVATRAEILRHDPRTGSGQRRKIAAPARPVGVARTASAARARLVRMRGMAGEGYNSEQIAAAIGVSAGRVRVHLHHNGIDCPGDRVRSTARHDASRILDHLVTTAAELIVDERLIDYATLDLLRLDEWIASLAESQRALGRFIGRLRTLRLKGHGHGEIETTATT